jgi:hypothetical protein
VDVPVNTLACIQRPGRTPLIAAVLEADDGPNCMHVWCLETGRCVTRQQNALEHCLASYNLPSTGGSRLITVAAMDEEGVFRVWDADGGWTAPLYESPDRRVRALLACVDPDTSAVRLVLGGSNGLLHFIDGELLSSFRATLCDSRARDCGVELRPLCPGPMPDSPFTLMPLLRSPRGVAGSDREHDD